MHHTIFTIQKVQQAHENNNCGMNNPFKNLFLQKGRISKRLGTNTILLGNPNTDINMKLFSDPMLCYTQGQKTTRGAESSLEYH